MKTFKPWTLTRECKKLAVALMSFKRLWFSSGDSGEPPGDNLGGMEARVDIVDVYVETEFPCLPRRTWYVVEKHDFSQQLSEAIYNSNILLILPWPLLKYCNLALSCGQLKQWKALRKNSWEERNELFGSVSASELILPLTSIFYCLENWWQMSFIWKIHPGTVQHFELMLKI